MKKLQFISLSVLILIVAGCSTTKLASYNRDTCAVPPGDAALKIIDDKCMLCHSGDFSSKDEICSRKNIIIDSVKTGRMPKIGSLNEAQIKIITDWK